MIMKRKNVVIIGTGLMGGSLALRLHETKLTAKTIGVDSNPEHARVALENEIVDEIADLDEALMHADVIVLAIPVDNSVSLLPRLLDKIDHQIVMDLGSTKFALTEAIKGHPKRGRFVAAHPMWGTENSGPSSVVRNAFVNRAVILCNLEESDPDAAEWVKYMFQKIGMRILLMNAADHDLHAAYVSHISHITSFALANTVLEKEEEESTIFELASAGFESTVRLAKSSPAMWAPIFLQNSEKVLDALQEHITQLEMFRNRIINADREGLVHLMEKANQIKRILA